MISGAQSQPSAMHSEHSNLFAALRYSAHEGMLIATTNGVERVSPNIEGTDSQGEISAAVSLETGINFLYFCINHFSTITCFPNYS